MLLLRVPCNGPKNPTQFQLLRPLYYTRAFVGRRRSRASKKALLVFVWVRVGPFGSPKQNPKPFNQGLALNYLWNLRRIINEGVLQSLGKLAL